MNTPSTPETSREAAERLVRNHRAFLEFVERRVADKQAAEDIVQEAFARSLDRLDQLRDEESVVAWFYRTLRNAIIDHYRRNASSDRGLDTLARELGDAEEPSPELRDFACRCVVELAEDLEPNYADAIRKIDVEGQAVKDYAAEHGITANNAGVRVFRARQALRRQVARACGTCATHGCIDCTCGPSSSSQ